MSSAGDHVTTAEVFNTLLSTNEVPTSGLEFLKLLIFIGHIFVGSLFPPANLTGTLLKHWPMPRDL